MLLNMLSPLLHHPLHFNSTTSKYVPHARINPQSLDHLVLHSAYFGTRVRHGTLHDADRYPSHAYQEHRQCSAGAEARFPESTLPSRLITHTIQTTEPLPNSKIRGRSQVLTWLIKGLPDCAYSDDHSRGLRSMETIWQQY